MAINTRSQGPRIAAGCIFRSKLARGSQQRACIFRCAGRALVGLHASAKRGQGVSTRTEGRAADVHAAAADAYLDEMRCCARILTRSAAARMASSSLPAARLAASSACCTASAALACRAAASNSACVRHGVRG